MMQGRWYSFFFFCLICLTMACSTPTRQKSLLPGLAGVEKDIDNYLYQQALEKLKKIKQENPGSDVAIEADLKIAEVFFLQDDFLQAAIMYKAFYTFYPQHPKAQYALFQSALCYSYEVPTQVGRDLSLADEAMQGFEKFLIRYERTADYPEQVAKAKERIDFLRGLVASKELEIGDFYRYQGYCAAAKARYEGVILQFPHTQAAIKAQELQKQCDAVSASKRP